jgi:hypothetical protein
MLDGGRHTHAERAIVLVTATAEVLQVQQSDAAALKFLDEVVAKHRQHPDFTEATCWETGQRPDQMEIIEVGAVLLESSRKPVLRTFAAFVRPVESPVPPSSIYFRKALTCGITGTHSTRGRRWNTDARFSGDHVFGKAIFAGAQAPQSILPRTLSFGLSWRSQVSLLRRLRSIWPGLLGVFRCRVAARTEHEPRHIR